MIIRVDRKNYFYDARNRRQRLEEYDPFNENLKFRFQTQDGYSVHVNQDNIRVTKIGICFDFAGKTYVIDDNHQQVLSYAAYIINSGFYNKIEGNTEKGLAVRDNISYILYQAMNTEFPQSGIHLENFQKKGLNYCADFRLGSIGGKLTLQTISNLVNTNKVRRDLDLPYYPYIRGIDRYNSFYMTLWCNENDDGSNDKMSFDIFLNELIGKINEASNYDFSAKTLPTNVRIIRVRDDLVPAC